MKTLPIFSKGYEKRFPSGGWLIAANGFDAEVNSPAAVTMIGRHRETDEAFVLLQGSGFLVTAGFGGAPANLCPTRLLVGQLTVVERGEWHALVLLENAQTLIVENADTGAENSDRVPLTDKQREMILTLY
ncbi:MAG: hypothetical protein ABFD03_05065 [Clostridiaceae bacterium]